MSFLEDYHIHSRYCDGADEPEEIIRSAISKGMHSIGFSGHSYVEWDDGEYNMSPEGTKEYYDEILRLRDKYKNRIKIYLGLEQDFYSEPPNKAYDYLIGSVHSVYADGRYVFVDWNERAFRQAISESFGGDVYSFAKAYYNSISILPERSKCDIIGHFDLITKFNEGMKIFDEGDIRYKKAYMSAVDRLALTDVFFEINVGAIIRGYKSTPYPSLEVAEYIAGKNGIFVLNSDSHSKDSLCFEFEKWEKIYRAIGCKIVSFGEYLDNKKEKLS